MSPARKKILVLERRRAFLADRLLNYHDDGNPSYTIAEVGALEWALGMLAAANYEGVFKQLDGVRATLSPADVGDILGLSDRRPKEDVRT